MFSSYANLKRPQKHSLNYFDTRFSRNAFEAVQKISPHVFYRV